MPQNSFALSTLAAGLLHLWAPAKVHGNVIISIPSAVAGDRRRLGDATDADMVDVRIRGSTRTLRRLLREGPEELETIPAITTTTATPASDFPNEQLNENLRYTIATALRNCLDAVNSVELRHVQAEVLETKTSAEYSECALTDAEICKYLLVLDKLSDEQGIHCEEDGVVKAAIAPNEPAGEIKAVWNDIYESSQTEHALLGVRDLWLKGITGSDGVIVAIIDSGIDKTHSDLKDNMWVNTGEIPDNGIDDDGNGFVDDVNGWNFLFDNNELYDDYSHGTHIAGIIGARGNNNIGVAGIAWAPKLMGLKFMDSNGVGRLSNALKALNYAVANGATLSNNSWGCDGCDTPALYNAIQAAGAKNHLFIASAGNDGENVDSAAVSGDPVVPCGFDLSNIICVASSNVQDNALSKFSNFGAKSVHLSAPGEMILSTLPGDEYGYKSGTSMATPVVTGIAVLLRSQHPDITAAQIKDHILQTVTEKTFLEGMVATAGRVQADKAVTEPLPTDTTDSLVTAGAATTTLAPVATTAPPPPTTAPAPTAAPAVCGSEICRAISATSYCKSWEVMPTCAGMATSTPCAPCAPRRRLLRK